MADSNQTLKIEERGGANEQQLLALEPIRDDKKMNQEDRWFLTREQNVNLNLKPLHEVSALSNMKLTTQTY